MYKKSQFNILVDLEKNGFILRNLLTGKVVVVSPEKAEYVNATLSGNLDLSIDIIGKKLIQYGFMIPSDIIEYQQANYLKNRISYGNRLNVVIMPTNGCNFKCVYCFESERYQTMNADNVNAIISFLDRNMKRFIGTDIQWFGGEPLLCKDIIKTIMEAALSISKRDKTALSSGITTNGYLLDLEMYQNLCKWHVNWIQISVDGTPTIHNRQRPHKTNPDSYSKIISNLKEIRDNTYPGMCKIYYRITITKEMLPYINEILEFYKNEFSNDSRFRLSLQPEMDWGGERIENEKANLPTVRETVECLQKACRFGLLPIGHHTQLHSGLICEACRVNSYVFYPGLEVYKCPMAIYSDSFNPLISGKVGSLQLNGSLSINHKVQAEWVESSPIYGDSCHKCKYYILCYGVQTCPYARKFSKSQNKNICKKNIYDEYIPAETYILYELNRIDDIIQ